jgi:hypothetical protein
MYRNTVIKWQITPLTMAKVAGLKTDKNLEK